MRISDWSSDVCSSDLGCAIYAGRASPARSHRAVRLWPERWVAGFARGGVTWGRRVTPRSRSSTPLRSADGSLPSRLSAAFAVLLRLRPSDRSEEHTSGTPVTNAHLVCRLLLEKKKKTHTLR